MSWKIHVQPVNHISDNIKNMLDSVRVCLRVHIFWIEPIHAFIHDYLHFVELREKNTFVRACVRVCDERESSDSSAPYFKYFWQISHWNNGCEWSRWRSEWNTQNIHFICAYKYTITNKQLGETDFRSFVCGIFVFFSQSNFFLCSFCTSTKIMAIHQIENKVNCNNLLHENVSKYLKTKEKRALFGFHWRLHAIFACVSKCLKLLILCIPHLLVSVPPLSCGVKAENTCYVESMFAMNTFHFLALFLTPKWLMLKLLTC